MRRAVWASLTLHATTAITTNMTISTIMLPR
jgi:hypothetical protein